ncbi:(d)CMP kinase [Nocardioides zeae]|uniref:Cytidylate kinase n=1 Tax=Nocardioides imazamoxiresistens TaxID=3231893 RepID=A0ABU3PTS0_9ACTN|nr:(d)CMP kinase [Nocardioides zeae]MDT9592242.1 (d)CMP kinase [Nocardioides zeae]
MSTAGHPTPDPADRPADRRADRPADQDAAGLVIALDGTSGSGKSSTSRGVAARLGLAYLDTGAQFRAVTWWLLQQGVDVHDTTRVAALADTPRLVSGTDPGAPTITVDGEDVSGPIRSEAVNAAVSPVSAVPEVRARLLALQRAAISEALATGRGIVVEGRDIGSVVWPAAPVKVYLHADASARAARRATEEGGSDPSATEQSLLARDAIDSTRATAPLVRADGAVEIDTTPFTLDEVVGQVVGLAEAVEART